MSIDVYEHNPHSYMEEISKINELKKALNGKPMMIVSDNSGIGEYSTDYQP